MPTIQEPNNVDENNEEEEVVMVTKEKGSEKKTVVTKEEEANKSSAFGRRRCLSSVGYSSSSRRSMPSTKVCLYFLFIIPTHFSEKFLTTKLQLVFYFQMFFHNLLNSLTLMFKSFYRITSLI